MKTRIMLKDFSALSFDAGEVVDGTVLVNLAHASEADAPERPGLRLVPPASEDFRELLHRRYTTPYHCVIPTSRWGLKE